MATELQTARNAKLVSMRNAIKRYNDYDDLETQEEYDRIQEEDALSAKLTETP